MIALRRAACSAAWALLANSAAAVGDDIAILKPPAGKTGTTAAWIFIPGAEIDHNTYAPLAQAVQQEFSGALWVALLGTYLAPSVLPPELGPRIDAALKEMEQQGMNLKGVKLFYGGHSLGSVFIQDHLAANHGSKGPMGGTIDVLGQVLMGGFIQRKYTYPDFSYPVSTLTVGGELDGLARCTRLAEAFYHTKGKAAFPVEIVMGMTHMQFASGVPPALVKARDLTPEIEEAAAHTAVAQLVAPYFEGRAGLSSVVRARVSSTEEFVKPIIAAYEYEGSRNFNAPAQIGGPGAKQCVKGGCPSKSEWAKEGQRTISTVQGWNLNVDNEYVDCSSTPLTGAEFHLPKITNDSSSKSISITTYSQGYWDDAIPSWFDWKEIFEQFDTGFVATSAEELGTKLASRQCTLIQGLGEPNVSFSSDDPDFCGMTNQKAYQWASSNAGSAASARFLKYGQKYTFGPDKLVAGGPLFLDQHLAFTEKTDSSGEKVIEVTSIAQKTEIDYWKKHFGPIPRPSGIPDPGCFHYCKLLSPARAMEWIYVDGLRAKRSLPGETTIIV